MKLTTHAWVTMLLISTLSLSGCGKTKNDATWDKDNLSAIVTDELLPESKILMSTTPDTNVQISNEDPEDEEEEHWCAA
jgi:hypothetical protein